MRKVFSICILLCFFSLSYAQERLGNVFGISGGVYIPSEELLKVYKNGYGVSLNGKFRVSKKLAITAEAGLYIVQKKLKKLGFDEASILGFGKQFVETLKLLAPEEYTLDVPSAHFVPVNLGIQYTIINKKFSPYVGVGMGLYTTHTKGVEINFNEFFGLLPASVPVSSNGLGKVSFDATDLNFGSVGIIGSTFAITERAMIDASGKYHFIIAPDRDGAANFWNINLGFSYLF